MPGTATAACLRCLGVEDRGIRTVDEAADVAREHAAAHLDADAGLPERRLLGDS